MSTPEGIPYRSRPAWRDQWLAILILFVTASSLLTLTVVFFVDSTGAFKLWLAYSAAILIILFSIPILYRRYKYRFFADDENIESSEGIIARQLQSIRVKDLRNINVRQTFMQRLLRIGDVEFSSAAGGGVEVVFFAVTRPLSVKHRIQALQDQTPSPD